MLSATVTELLQRLPNARSPNWSDGERFVDAFAHGSLAIDLQLAGGLALSR